MSNTPTETAEPFPPPFSLSLLHPKHWPMWLLMGVWYGISQLPYAWQLVLGRKLGHLLIKMGGSRVKISKINIERCLPELSQQEQDALLKKSFEAAATGLLEVGMGWWMSDKRLAKKTTIEGLEHLKAAQASGQGVLLITGHFTPMEIGARLVGQTAPCRLLYRKNNNPIFEWVSSRRRARNVAEMVPHKQIKHFLQCIKAGDVAIYLTDQHYGSKHSVYAPFFGIETATIRKTAEYAHDTNAVVMPVQYGRKPGNEGYFLRFHPAIENFPSGDDIADAKITNDWVETFAREIPEQYFWQHRRFKKVGPGIEKFY